MLTYENLPLQTAAVVIVAAKPIEYNKMASNLRFSLYTIVIIYLDHVRFMRFERREPIVGLRLITFLLKETVCGLGLRSLILRWLTAV